MTAHRVLLVVAWVMDISREHLGLGKPWMQTAVLYVYCTHVYHGMLTLSAGCFIRLNKQF